MSDTTTTSTTAETIAEDAASILLNVVPALGPYGAAISLAFQVVAATAPAIYAEITALINRIQAGGEPTAADIANLQALIANLKNPDAYFNGAPGDAATK
jgi:hypothetical protein